jgi:hypothetical protein
LLPIFHKQTIQLTAFNDKIEKMRMLRKAGFRQDEKKQSFFGREKGNYPVEK